MLHGNLLPLERCPHCSIAKPSLHQKWAETIVNHRGTNQRAWATYYCLSCGGVVLAVSPDDFGKAIDRVWPSMQTVSDAVPARAREYLSQAISSIHTPAGAVMLTASSVDSMLKDKGYKEGSLNARISQAARDHLITSEMAAWAHEIRLDANDQRHADEEVALPSEGDAMKVIEFANALAQFLYVLPARVERGRRPST